MFDKLTPYFTFNILLSAYQRPSFSQYPILNKPRIENLAKYVNKIMAYFVDKPALYYLSETTSIASSIEKIVKSETEGISKIREDLRNMNFDINPLSINKISFNIKGE
jgi:hypothetical protein